jgi:hypothetical protein
MSAVGQMDVTDDDDVGLHRADYNGCVPNQPLAIVKL